MSFSGGDTDFVLLDVVLIGKEILSYEVQKMTLKAFFFSFS